MKPTARNVIKLIIYPLFLYIMIFILFMNNPALSEGRDLSCRGSWDKGPIQLMEVQFRNVKNATSGATIIKLIDSEKNIIMSETNNIKWDSSRIVFGSKRANGEYFQQTKKIRLVIKASWVASLIFKGECEMSYVSDF